ncbi:hypothetical protein [Stutzerimonas nitrititolerans]|uniref:hypothetical protein n=1 Tax=Stutzerimonas nitrititolerans TaxID=2482751 RepID=UPI0028969DF2|nr:hypothetical protein [Stutzerimonas nitrititolerans]
MSIATAENFSGFNWVFGIWESVALTILAATEPLFVAFNETSTGLIAASGFAWLVLIASRVASDGIVRALAGGILIFLVVAYGLKPASMQLPSGATVRLVEAQAIPLKFVMTIHRLYRQAFDKVLSDQTVAGTVIPAQAAIDDLVGRSADLFADSDLAQLIRDYNSSCAPSPAELAGPEHSARIEALHAIGLFGGGGLGIPDSELGLLAQARTTFGGAWEFVFGSAEENGGWGAYLIGGGAARVGLQRSYDMRAMQSRREAGIKAIEKVGPFMGGRYALPTQAHWAAKFAGQPDATAGYLPISLMPGQKSAIVGDVQAIMFQPTSCIEAYRIAQLGAEQAYQALKESGAVIAGGQRVSAEVGAVSTAVAWHRFMSRSLEQTTGISREGSEIASGILATAQMFKNVASWLDLQTLLPGYVFVAAWVFWIVLLLAPLFLLLAPLRGAQMLGSWLALLLLPVVGIIVVQALIVAISQVTAAVAVAQAGAASGWTGSGAEFDGLRGLMSTVAAISLTLASWIAGSMLGVSPSGLAGSLSGAVATASDAGRFASRAVGAAMLISRLGGAGVASRSRGGAAGFSTANRVASSASSAIRVRTVMTQFAPSSRTHRTGASSPVGPGPGALNPPKPKNPPPSGG